MCTRRLFRSKKVLLEDGMQEAGVLVGEDGKIDKILKKEELSTQSDVEVTNIAERCVKINKNVVCVYDRTAEMRTFMAIVIVIYIVHHHH